MFRSLSTCLLGGLFAASPTGYMPGSSAPANPPRARAITPNTVQLKIKSEFAPLYPRNALGLLRTNAFRARGSAVLLNESAVASDVFVDSMGMNAHFEAPSYYQNYPLIRALIANLGVRHYRVSAGMILAQPRYLSQLLDLQASYGITFDVLTSWHILPAQVVQAIGLLPVGSVDSVEGPNETDTPRQGYEYDPNFATDIPAYMNSLYATLKSTPATSRLTVIGPSFANYKAYGVVGNLSKYVDAGNMHDYFAGFNPGTRGWGPNGSSFAPTFYYGSIDWNIGASAQATGSKPVVATETGYFTAPLHGGLPLNIQAKYVPRLFLEQYRHNVARTFLYQLVGYNAGTSDGSLDIVSPSYAASPSYNALAGMIGLLGEGGHQGNAIAYAWSLSGQIANVDHLLMHKSDGTFVLPLWIEVPSYNVNANGGSGAEVAVPQQTVTVNVAQAATSGVLWTYDTTSGAWSSQPLAISNGGLTFNISDSISILEIGPSAQTRSFNRARVRVR